MGDVTLYGLGCRTTVKLPPGADDLDDALRRAWARCLSPIGPDDLESDPVPIADGAEGAGAPDIGATLQSLTQQITYSKIRAQAGRVLMLHASAVAHPATGASVAFVAPGGTGKTTLARALGNRYGYLTDETVAVTAEGVILPYPKPLSIRRPPDDRGKTETSPDDLRLRPAPARPFLSRIILLDRSEEHGPRVDVEEVSPFDAIAALAPESSSLSALPRPLHWVADLLDGLAPTVRLRCRDVHSAMDVAATWLDGR